jgi:hypothetical protein
MCGPVIVALALTACGGSGTNNAGSSFGISPMAVSDATSPINFSGQYSGTFKNKTRPPFKAKASFVQYGSAVGGAIKFVKVPGGTADISWNANGATVLATFVIVDPTGFCQFNLKGTYDATTGILSGPWHAVHGCRGFTGSVTLKHDCTYKAIGTDAVRHENGPKPC